jgi:hypothetical protein
MAGGASLNWNVLEAAKLGQTLMLLQAILSDWLSISSLPDLTEHASY